MTPAFDAVARVALMSLAGWAARALAVAAVVGLVLAIVRPRRAVVSIAGWTVVLVAALSMPIIVRVVPAVSWTVAMPLPIPEPPTVIPGIASPTSRVTPTHVPTANRFASPTPPATASALEPATAVPSHTSWATVWLAVYLAGVLALALRAVHGWQLARRLSRSARLIEDANALEHAAGLAAEARVRRPMLAEAASLVVPVTTSVVRPAILLPPGWRAWPGDTLRAVLTHETAHVAHHDLLIHRLALLHRDLFWFSPLSWWLSSRLSRLAEHASDEAVLDAGTDRASYAEIVLGFFADLGHARTRAHWPGIAMARGSNASRRVERILEWRPRSRRFRTLRVAAMILAGALVSIGSAAIQPVLAFSFGLPPMSASPSRRPIAAVAQQPETTPARAALPSRPAPQTAAPASSGDTRSVSVDYHVVDVRARDTLGQPVPDLRPDEVSVFEDGIEQTLRTFYATRRTLGTSMSSPPSGRAFIVLVDDASISRAELPQLTRILTAIRDHLVHDGDLIGIVSTGASSVEADLSYDRDHTRLNTAIKKISDAKLAEPLPMPASTNAAPGPVELRSLFQSRLVAVRTAEDVLARAAQMTDRPKALLWIGDDTKVDADFVSAFATLTRDAIRAQTRVYSITPRGMTTIGGPGRSPASDESFDRPLLDSIRALKKMAEGTGGFIAAGTDPTSDIVQVDLATGAVTDYYTLGYAISNRDPAKPRRTVEVRTTRPGIELIYSHEYIYK